MDFYSAVFEMIDMRSFSNLWYWIALAAVWSQTSRFVMGVPYDMIQRAGRQGGQAQTDLEDMVRINCNRMIYIIKISGVWLVAFMAMVLTILALLGFFYDVEFAQAVFLLLAPMMVVGFLMLNTANVIQSQYLAGADLRRRLIRHRIATQFVGMIAILVTAMWGMLQNMNYGALGI